MLGWKYFCFFCLLLLYQLQDVLAELEQCGNIDLSGCNIANSDPNVDIYKLTNCISNNVIYKINDDNTCYSKLNPGVHVFVPSEFLKKNIEIDLTSENTIAHEEVTKGSMYVCSESKCLQTVGYIKINVLYTLLKSGEYEDWDKIKYSIYTKAEDNTFQRNKSIALTFNEGYIYHNDTNVSYFISQNNGSRINIRNESCNNNSIGIFNSNDGVCLGVNSLGKPISLGYAPESNDEYILTNKFSDSEFTIPDGKHAIILKQAPNIIYHYNLRNEVETIIIDTDTKKKAKPLTDTELDNSNLNKYYIYECKDGNCSKIIGHNIINVITMKRIEFNTDINDADIQKLAILNCDSNSCNRTFGYFKTTNKYYSIPHTGFSKNSKYSLITVCNDDTIGQIRSGGNGEIFCQGLYEIENAMTKDHTYIISTNYDTVFSGRIEGKSLVISATANTLIYNGLSKNEGVKLFDKGVMIPTTEINLNDDDKLVLYYCNNKGICHSLRGYFTDGTNFYKVEIDEIKTSEKIELDKQPTECNKNTAGKLISDKTLCLGKESVDFISEENKTAYYIYKEEDKYSFVRGVKNMFTIEEFKGSVELDEFNVINTDIVTIIDIKKNNEIDLTESITNLALFNCDIAKGICRQTYGYIKSNNKYYSFDADKSKANAEVDLTTSKCEGTSDIGTLQSGGYLCLINDTSNSMTNNNKYVISVSASNIFLREAKNIVVKSTSFAFYYDNLYDVTNGKNVVLTDDGTKITEIPEINDITKLKAYLCNTFGICTKVDGFVKKDDKYYKITDSGTSDITSGGLEGSCSNKINSLLKGGKLCITESDNDAINFITDGNVSYYMTLNGATEYRLVIAKKNLFIVASTTGDSGGPLNLINLNDAAITNFSSNKIVSDDLPYLALFSCDTNKNICKRTYGYVKDGESKYYAIYFGGTKTNAKIEIDTSCSETNIGMLDNTGSMENLCLGTSYPFQNSKSYIISKSSDKSVFHQEQDISIYITSTANAFYHDKFVDVSTDGGVKLFQSNQLVQNISTATELSLYICSSEGICLQAEGYASESNKYYSIGTSGSKEMENNDYVTECSGNTGKLNSEKKFCIGGTDSENYPDKVDNYIIFDPKARLVKTANGLIAKVEITEELFDGLNIYRIESEISKFEDFNEEIETSTLTNLYFFNCDLSSIVKKCKQTYGYLRGKDTIYEINANGIKSEVTSVTNCDNTAIGSITSENKICINGVSNNNNVDFTSKDIYVIDSVADNVFTGSAGKPIVTNSTSNAIFYDNIYRGNDVLLTASNTVIQVGEIDSNNDTKLKVYSCEISGICNPEGGFVTDGNGKYYSLSKNSSSDEINLGISCNGNIGKLITNGKLCLNGNDNEAVPFVIKSDDKTSYVIKESSGFQFITAIPNIFLISVITGLVEGVNIVNNKSSSIVNPTTIDEKDLDLPNLGLFYCIKENKNSSELFCKKTYGYIKIKDKYYSIGWNGTNSEAPQKECTTNSDIGSLNSLGALCLYNGNTGTLDASKKYIISNSNGSVFANKNEISSNILIYADANSYVFENIVDLSDDHGIKLFESNKLIDTSAAPSSATSLSLYNCNSEGVCNRAEGYAKIQDKYYKIQTSDSLEIPDTDYIESCSSSNTGKLEKTNKKFCIGDTDSISFPTSYNNYIIYEDSKYKFVKTIANIIIKMALNDNNGTSPLDENQLDDLNLIDCEKAKIITMNDDNLKASLLTANISNYSLFRCDKEDKICKQTYGYLASSDVSGKKYYSFTVNTANGATVDFTTTVPTCNGETDIGKLQTNGELCLNSNIISTTNGNNIYSISNKNDSIFSKAGTNQSVIVRSNGKVFYLDNYYKEKGVNLFVSYIKSATSKVNDSIASTVLCNCTREGICTTVNGYIRSGENYYSIGATNELVSEDKFGKTCSSSSDGGKLLSNGKLCLGMDSIEFLSENKKEYYIGFEGTETKFIRAIENIFTIEDFTGTLNDGANLVNVETADIISVGTDAIDPILEQLAYFNCEKDKVCKRTMGYLKSNDKYYAIHNLTSANDIVTQLDTECSIGENGKLDKDGKFCSFGNKIDWGDKDIIVPLIKNDTPFTDYNGNTIVISVSSNHIILNNLYKNSGPNLINKDGMKTQDLANIGTDIQKLLLYNCGGNGVCLSNTGYITDGSKCFEINNKIENTQSTFNNNKECIFSNTIGKINKDQEFVIENNESIPFLNSGEKADYLIKEGTLLVRAIEGIFSIGSTSGTVSSGLNGVIRDNATIFSLPSTSTAIEEGIDSLGLYDCNDKKVCKQTYGYLKSTDTDPSYYSISVDSTNTRIVPESSCSKVGDLITNWKLCIDISNPNSLINGNVYIFDAKTASVFNKATTESNLFVMVKGTSNSITLKFMEDGYEVSKNDGNVITTATANDFSQNPSKIGIYGCKSQTSTCKLVSGYAISGTNYYTFESDKLTATAYTVGTEVNSKKSNYCKGTIGLIVKETSKYYLCLGDGISVELSQGNDGNYIAVEAVQSGSPLEAKKMIRYSSKSVGYIVNDDYFESQTTNYVIKVPNSNLSTQENYYRYSFDSSNYSLNEERDIGAYEQLKEGNVYKDISSKLYNDDSVHLFFCKSGECDESDGYMSIESKMYTNENTDRQWKEGQNTNNCSPSQRGKINIDSSKLKVCMKNGDSDDYTTIDSSKDYMINLEGKNNYQEFVSNSGSSIIGKPDEKDGYYLIKDDVIITDTDVESNIIVKCESSTCMLVETEEGYYSDANGNAVIHCSEEGGKISCKLEKIDKSSTFIDAGDTSHLIYCEVDTDNGNKVDCSSFESNASEGNQEHYISGNGELITCTYNKEKQKPECVTEGSDVNGYFMDSSPQDDTDRKIIKCEDSKCEEKKVSDLGGTGPGTLSTNSNGNISIKIDDTTSIEVKVGSQTSYQSIDVEANGFPGVKEKSTISIKIGEDGSVIYLEDTSLGTCGSSCKSELYCWEANNNKIQTDVNGDCEDINGKNHAKLTEAGKTILFYESNGKSIEEPTTDTPNIMAYQCNFNGDDEDLPQEKCSLIKGYLISQDKKIRQCNGWKREGCHIIVEKPGPCADGDEGRLGEGANGKEVCFGKNIGVPLPTKEDEVRYVAFQVNSDKTNGVNEIYGKNKGDIVFLALIKNSVLVAEDGEAINEGIYLNWSGKSLADGLIDCTGQGDIETCKIRQGNGYYLDASSLFKREANGRKRANEKELYSWLIKCETERCQLISTPNTGYYINAVASNALVDALIRCPDETYCIAYDGNENDIYINNADDKIIQCTSNKCVGVSNNNKMLGDANIPTYFKNADVAADDSSVLIKCSGTCVTMSTGNNSVFLNGNLKADGTNDDGESGKPLIICTTKIDSGTGNSYMECVTSEAKDKESYFMNAGDYTKDNKKLPLIECTTTVDCKGKEATLNNAASEVFYINSNYSDDNDTEYYLIKCTSESQCKYYSNENSDKNNEYYVHGDTNGIENAVIECTMQEKSDGEYKASCSLIKDPLSKNVYISSYNQKQVIICSTTECTAQDNGSTSRKTEYYINTDPSDGVTNSLIECSYNDKCKIVDEIEDENQVFMNSNFGKGDGENQLIKCEEGECQLSKSQATKDKPEYYANSGDSDNSGDYRGDVLECIADDSNKVTCNPITSSEGSVYINADYDNDKNKNQIIICQNKVCEEKLIEYTEEKTECNFINAGKENGGGGLIMCYEDKNNGECTVSVPGENNIFIDDTTGQLIVCDETGCHPKSSGASPDNNEYYLNGDQLIKCEVKDGKKVCSKVKPIPTLDDGVFINSAKPGEIIYCDGTKCESKPSTADVDKPQYFVNGDDESDLIECTKKGEKVNCKAISGSEGDVFMNGSFPDPDNTNQIIKCDSQECKAVSIGGSSDGNPQYFVNTGNKNSDKLKDALIVCDTTGCKLEDGNVNDVYVNYNEDTKDEKPLIKCEKLGCSVSSSGATSGDNEHYINAGKIGDPPSEDTPSQKGIIECSADSSNNKVICKVKKSDDVQEGLYLNSNYSEDGDTNQLIKCSKEDGCVGKAIMKTTGTEYYVNGESTSLENAILACTGTKCEKQTPKKVPSYYVGKDENENQGLIECIETTISSQRRSTRSTTQKCTFRPTFNSEGYYLNNGYNKFSYPLIQCDSLEGCHTVDGELGYYVNAGNSQKPVIVCERENDECYERVSPLCPEQGKALPGNYCYAEKKMKFFKAKSSEAVSAPKNQDIFVSATIPRNGFPGIRSSTFALFKISYYSINRYYKNGSVIVDKNGKVVSSLEDMDPSDYTIYTCDENTKVCTESKKCTPNTYLYDSIHKRAIRCNEDGKLEYTDEDGYVIDASRGLRSSTIIYCDKNGDNCYMINPNQLNGDGRDDRDGIAGHRIPKTVYYTNGDNLIQCTDGVCVQVSIKPGNYLGYGDDGVLGIIRCYPNNTCVFLYPEFGFKYLNSGSDGDLYPLIECTLTDGCYVTKGNPGYYLTTTNNILILCRSSITCYEVKAMEHYYFNAECTEENNTIIKCVEGGNEISCLLENALNGYYLTSEQDILVHCSIASRCKQIRVHNGVFRSALKGDVSIKKRSVKEEEDLPFDEIVNSLDRKHSKRENESQETKDYYSRNDELAKAKKTLSSRDINDNIDDVYGIIRCVDSRCAALTINELAAVPICEYSNDRCYITLDYSMTKGATSSIGAGEFCTNSDHSILYFATDTIVVKPNVISGQTATYVYTTSTTNCLEADDSHQDMYFAEKASIYTLNIDCIIQIYETAYIFLNNKENRIVRSRNIDDYNDSHVKLYRCKGSNCRNVDGLNAVTYFVDINKQILKYNKNNQMYEFAYDKDITCIYQDNQCTPNADMKKNEFCVTYKGELVLVPSSIKNRETGDCLLSDGMNSYIYGFSQHLYQMNKYAAQMVDQTGYYIVNLFTNTTIDRRSYLSKNNINLVMYACTHSSCHVSEPDEDTYYYDFIAKTIFRYRNGKFNLPNTSGYAYVSVDPTQTYIYKFVKAATDEVKIQNLVSDGYYYTIDNEMYHCNQDESHDCSPIDETGYYITNTGAIYYCIHDSEELEETECTKQLCISGQYYFVEDVFYRCDSHSNFVPMKSRYCSYDENVIINFPLALTEELPVNIKQAVKDISHHNNSTAVSRRRGKNYLESVSGIFTNCTYNAEESTSSFDLVCINNYVDVDKEKDEVRICSIEKLGYVECIESEENPGKCNISSDSNSIKPSLFMFLCSILISIILIFNIQ